MAQKVLDALKSHHAAAIEHTESQHGDEIAWVKRDQLVAVATWLKNDPAMLFDAPVFCTCIDRLDWQPQGVPPSQRWTEDKPRFEIAYQLRSFSHRHRLRLKIAVPESDPR